MKKRLSKEGARVRAIKMCREYYKKNKLKINQDRRKYYSENKDKIREKSKKYYKKNKQRINELKTLYYKRRGKDVYKKYRAKNKERLSKYAVNHLREKRYNITSEEYDKLLEKQSNRCAVCNMHQSELKRSLAVDHDHKTGMIRGLLCSNCNAAIGMLRESLILIEKLKEYLQGA